MLRLGNEYFFGVLLVLLGLFFIIRQFFNINIPIFRILLGLFFIYLGISIIIGGFGIRSGNNMVFSSGTINVINLDKEYNLIFSDGKVDLTGYTPQGRSSTKINTIFSSGTIRVNSRTPAVLKVNSAFGNADIPDGNSIHLGNYSYATKSFRPDTDYLEINASVVFGNLQIIEI